MLVEPEEARTPDNGCNLRLSFFDESDGGLLKEYTKYEEPLGLLLGLIPRAARQLDYDHCDPPPAVQKPNHPLPIGEAPWFLHAAPNQQY